jgi:hypothetical protein
VPSREEWRATEALPFDPGVDIGDAAFAFALVPFESGASVMKLLGSPRRAVLDGLRLRIGMGEREKLTLTLADRPSAEAFLDEDQLVFHGHIELTVAGFVSMIPGIGAGGVSS